MIDFLKYTFIQNAFIGALLASILTSIIGAIIIEKKMVMLSGGISHSAFGGIGLGYYLGVKPIYGALVFAILFGNVLPALRRKEAADMDSLIGMLWSLGMAIGILFIYITPGYPPDISSYLFGNILTIKSADLVMMVVVTVLTLAMFMSFYHAIKLYIFDEEYAKVIGLNTVIMDQVLYTFVAISIVVMIKLVGIILLMTMLIVPASIAKLFVRSFSRLIKLAFVISLALTSAGLLLSFAFDIPSGATIILVSVLSYAAALLLRSRLERSGK